MSMTAYLDRCEQLNHLLAISIWPLRWAPRLRARYLCELQQLRKSDRPHPRVLILYAS